MNENFTEKTRIEKLAYELLCTILNNCYYPDYFTKYHKETEKYYCEFKKEYEDSLNDIQKEDFNTLMELDSASSSTGSVYNIMYGMKIKSALDEIINNPLKVLEVYDGKATCARQRYKSVKQKTGEKDYV